MDKMPTAKLIADKLFATEAAVDQAMVQASQLLEAMIVARKEIGVAATTGEVAQARVVEALSAMSEARRAVMASHGALASLSNKMGLDTKALGPDDKPEEDSKPQGSALRIAG